MRVVLCCLVVLALVAGSNAVNLQRAFSRGPSACPATPAMPGDDKCIGVKGTCFFTGSCDCVGGEVLSKMCGGSAGRKCCKGGALQQKAEAAAFDAVIAQCKAEPQTDADKKCKTAGGTCIDSKKCGCDNGFKSGLCGGAGSRRCCVGNVVREDNRADVDPRIQGQQAPAPARGALFSDPKGKTKPIKCADLFAAYPQGESPAVRDMILPAPPGTNDWIQNTCALRMSFTLSTLGVPIPAKTQSDNGGNLRLKAAKHPKTGADRFVYFRVAVLDQYMREAYGLPAKEITKPGKNKLDNLGVDPAEFKDLKGIIRFNIPIWSDASGHFDIWDGQNMLESHHNNAETKARYFSNARSVAVWTCTP